ncbi:MAG: polysaccharide deacetylase family protein [Candidatus Latescibacteria bacterium]|nr:polysaccharide deacetylase family protein [Candidatus Latescibacterota bacterium]
MSRRLHSLVLNLHHTPARWSPFVTATGVQALRRILESLRSEGYRFVAATECGPTGSEPGSVALTADDGYESHARHLAPLLRELAIPWTVFVLTGAIGRSNRWDLPLMGARERHLTEEEIARLSKDGVSIGAHGATHRDFRSLGDQELAEELVRSRDSLARLTGRRVTAISYPRGGVDRRVALAAHRAGFRIGFGTAGAPELPGDLRALSLRRTALYAPDQIPGMFRWTALRGPRALRWIRPALASLGDALIVGALRAQGGRDA